MTQTQYFALQGGLNLVTPAIRMPSGHAIAGVNYEPHPGGYRRIDGYERFDGHPKPSEASYWILRFDAGTTEVTEDDTVTGATSGATGRAVIDGVVESGSYGGNDAAGYLVLMTLEGEFQDGEDLEVSSSKVAESDGTESDRGALTDAEDSTWYQAAIEKSRDDIDKVPGSGPVRGVWVYGADTYAFRDNAGGTAGVMHKATSSGWAAQDLGRELAFDTGGLVEASFADGGLRELAFTSGGPHELLAGDEIEGATSGATAKVWQVLLDSGSWEAEDAEGRLILETQTGTFVSENLDHGAETNVATISADSVVIEIEADDTITGATTGTTAVVRSVTLDSGAWGDGDAAGTLVLEDLSAPFLAEGVHQGEYLNIASVSELLSTLAIEAGDTITGDTSGATATVTRVVLESGDWSTGDAQGRLIFASQTGTFEEETLSTAHSGIASISEDASAITLPAGGRYDLKNHNFFGSSDLKRMYGANGEGRGFEWDGSVFVPIDTGMEDDRPTRIAIHRNHLFFAFRGGSVQHSSIANPYQWQVVTGAGELGIGEETTDMLASVSGVLAIFGDSQVTVLMGDDANNWNLRTLSDSAGAIAWSAQSIGMPVYLDNRGLRTLETTEQFGDFQIGTITQLIEPLFRTKRRSGATPVGSIRVRSKDQYRLFWSDGTGISVYFGRQPNEILPFDLGFTVTCAASGKDDAGDELLFVGDDEGMVYELDAGTSLDGEAVDAFIRLPFNHVGSPAQRKRWQKATLEVDSGPDTQLGLVAEFGYADPDQPPGQEQTFNVKGAGGFWDEGRFDEFYWSSPVEGLAEAPIDGLGRNLSIVVVSEATYEVPHILHGLILHFTYRGIVR